MASITHYCHEHPLLLLKQLPTSHSGKLICYGCQEPVIKKGNHDIDLYVCETCNTFFLHKSCAELPMEIVHESHEHPLFLLPKPPARYIRDCCEFRLQPGFAYHCFLDNFNVHAKCAFAKNKSIVSYKSDLILNHPSHKHPLTIQPRPTSFHCDACDVVDKDLSYHCSSCHYLIHSRCAMLPSRTTNHDVHPHPLPLSFGLPSQYHNFRYFCGHCEEKLFTWEEFWLYYCHLCRYSVHIKCMGKKKHQIEVNLTIDDLPCLPTRDKFVDLIQSFLLENNSLGNVEQEISVFSHKHPLMYSNDEQIIEDENEDAEQDLICDGCILPVSSPPFYYCPGCRYFLHLPCAKLPHQLQHPSHPHPLILTSDTRFYHHFECHYCYKYSHGFFFRCNVEGCDFSLDVKCAALPKAIAHEHHNHPLIQRPAESYLCSGCRAFEWNSDMFSCEY